MISLCVCVRMRMCVHACMCVRACVCVRKNNWMILYTDKGQPHDIVRSIKPVWNNFVFFEVNLVSFHQVIM